jgi:hypothetical protein
MYLRSIRRYSILAALCLITWLVWTPGRRRVSKTTQVPPSSKPRFDPNRTIEIHHSVAVVAPCDIGILLGVGRAFLPTGLTIGELTLSCSEEEIEAFTLFLHRTFDKIQIPMKIVHIPSTFPLEFSLLTEASKSPYQSVLILDSESVLHANSLLWINEAIAQAEATKLPAGPCGWQLLPAQDVGLAISLASDHNAAFLTPPFLVDPQQVHKAISGLSNKSSVWSSFAARISSISATSVGGRVVASPSFLCPIDLGPAGAFPLPKISTRSQAFVAVLAVLDQLLDFQDSLCRLASQGHAVRVILFTEPENVDFHGWSRGDSCYLRYEIWEPSTMLASILEISTQNDPSSVVLFVSSDLMDSSVSFISLLQDAFSSLLVIIPLTQLDLKHSMWMTALTTRQWESTSLSVSHSRKTSQLIDWNRLTLDLSVITNNRPTSLSRLLRSLNNAIYFGHSNIHLAIYMEQTADPETKSAVQQFHWRHGTLTVRHRVIKGGLIPAIVEVRNVCSLLIC